LIDLRLINHITEHFVKKNNEIPKNA
jgi:hypothetical protein